MAGPSQGGNLDSITASIMRDAQLSIEAAKAESRRAIEAAEDKARQERERQESKFFGTADREQRKAQLAIDKIKSKAQEDEAKAKAAAQSAGAAQKPAMSQLRRPTPVTGRTGAGFEGAPEGLIQGGPQGVQQGLQGANITRDASGRITNVGGLPVPEEITRRETTRQPVQLTRGLTTPVSSTRDITEPNVITAAQAAQFAQQEQEDKARSRQRVVDTTIKFIDRGVSAPVASALSHAAESADWETFHKLAQQTEGTIGRARALGILALEDQIFTGAAKRDAERRRLLIAEQEAGANSMLRAAQARQIMAEVADSGFLSGIGVKVPDLDANQLLNQTRAVIDEDGEIKPANEGVWADIVTVNVNNGWLPIHRTGAWKLGGAAIEHLNAAELIRDMLVLEGHRPGADTAAAVNRLRDAGYDIRPPTKGGDEFGIANPTDINHRGRWLVFKKAQDLIEREKMVGERLGVFGAQGVDPGTQFEATAFTKPSKLTPAQREKEQARRLASGLGGAAGVFGEAARDVVSAVTGSRTVAETAGDAERKRRFTARLRGLGLSEEQARDVTRAALAE